MRIKYIIAVLLVCGLAYGQPREKPPTRYFFSNGKHFAKVSGKTREPKVVVDTVNVVAGAGTIVLNQSFNREKNSVKATSNKDMFVTATGILSSPSATVYSYSCYISPNGDTVRVISSGGSADTSKVALQIVLK